MGSKSWIILQMKVICLENSPGVVDIDQVLSQSTWGFLSSILQRTGSVLKFVCLWVIFSSTRTRYHMAAVSCHCPDVEEAIFFYSLDYIKEVRVVVRAWLWLGDISIVLHMPEIESIMVEIGLELRIDGCFSKVSDE